MDIGKQSEQGATGCPGYGDAVIIEHGFSVFASWLQDFLQQSDLPQSLQYLLRSDNPPD